MATLGNTGINLGPTVLQQNRGRSSGGGAKQTGTNRVYWVGADNNVYLKGSNGVQNVGKYLGGNDAGFDASLMSGEASRIADPNPGGSGGGSGGGYAGGGSGGTVHPDTSSARALLQSQLDALGPALAKALAKQQTKYQNALNIQNANITDFRHNIADEQGQNSAQRDQNLQSATLAGQRGLQGLRAVLASLGALGGTGSMLASQAVGNETAQDITGANNQFATNKRALAVSLKQAENEDAQKRHDLRDLLGTNQGILRANNAKAQQDIQNQMAQAYDTAGDTADAATWRAKAAALSGQTNPSGSVTPFKTSPISASIPSLLTYLAGANRSTAKVSNPGAGNSANPFFFIGQRKQPLGA